jgi:oligoribonuclease (3'-5' exoribonuclease)
MTNDQPRSVVYCWFDTEYTDLDYNRAELLQVALIVTDETLRPIGDKPAGIPKELLTEDGFHTCIKPPPRSRISQHVLDNYQDLLERCAGAGKELDDVDTYLALYLDQFSESKAKKVRNRPILAGNSVHADYFLALKFLPDFVTRLNYRLLDVSSQKLEWRNFFHGEKFKKKGNSELIQKYYPGKTRVEGDKHDAYFDVQASIAELAFYRTHLKKLEGNL